MIKGWRLISSDNDFETYKQENAKHFEQTLLLFKGIPALNVKEEEKVFKTHSKYDIDIPIDWTELLSRDSRYYEYRVYRYNTQDYQLFRYRTKNIPLSGKVLEEILTEAALWTGFELTYYVIGNSLFAEADMKSRKSAV